MARIVLRNSEGGAIPPGRLVEGLRNLVCAIIFTIKRLGVDAVMDEAGEDGAGNNGVEPTLWLIGADGDGSTGLWNLGRILKLPVGGEVHDWREKLLC